MTGEPRSFLEELWTRKMSKLRGGWGRHVLWVCAQAQREKAGPWGCSVASTGQSGGWRAAKRRCRRGGSRSQSSGALQTGQRSVLPFCHPTAWNVDKSAGTVATTLGHEDEGHSWGGRG